MATAKNQRWAGPWRDWANAYYTNNKEKYIESCKQYYAENKEKLLEYSKNKRKENKIKSVISKLENISVEDLAKILIEARKTKLIEI